jgi:hypothetical protein
VPSHTVENKYKSKLFFPTSVGLESQPQSPSACALYWALDLAFHVSLGPILLSYQLFEHY